MPSTDDPIVYADSSALVKLIIDERETEALKDYFDDRPVIATSTLALVEVPRAVVLADQSPAVRGAARKLLDACDLVEVTRDLLRASSRLASRTLRTLDAIHLASAIDIRADEFVAYDRQLLAAADVQGLRTAQPGVKDPAAPQD